MTPKQIQTLLEKTQTALETLTTQLSETEEIDTEIKTLHELGRKAVELAKQVHAVETKMRARFNALSDHIDAVESVGSELETLNEQLMAFQDSVEEEVLDRG